MKKSESLCILCKHYLIIPEHSGGMMCINGDGEPVGPTANAPICVLGNYYLPAKEKDENGKWIPDIKECAGFEAKEPTTTIEINSNDVEIIESKHTRIE